MLLLLLLSLWLLSLLLVRCNSVRHHIGIQNSETCQHEQRHKIEPTCAIESKHAPETGQHATTQHIQQVRGRQNCDHINYLCGVVVVAIVVGTAVRIAAVVVGWRGSDDSMYVTVLREVVGRERKRVLHNCATKNKTNVLAASDL